MQVQKNNHHRYLNCGTIGWRVPRTGSGGVAAVCWTRGVVLVGAIFFLTGCFIGACSRGSAGRDLDLVTPRRHAGGHAASSGNTTTALLPPDQLHQPDSCTCVHYSSLFKAHTKNEYQTKVLFQIWLARRRQRSNSKISTI